MTYELQANYAAITKPFASRTVYLCNSFGDILSDNLTEADARALAAENGLAVVATDYDDKGYMSLEVA